MGDEPTLTKFDHFCIGAKKIQANCCCHRMDEKECFRARYPRPMDDCFNNDEEDDDWAECECACHMEIGELERDIWPDED